MYAVTVKPMCSLINTVLQLIRHLVCSCLFAREHNISGDEKSSDHAKPRQNRRVQFSYHKHQSLPRATGTIIRGKQRSRRQSHTNEEQFLISVIGAKGYDVLSHLCSPIPPSDETYAQLTTILKNHFAPKKLVIAERYRFHNCTKRVGESVAAFASSGFNLPVRHSPE